MPFEVEHGFSCLTVAACPELECQEETLSNNPIEAFALFYPDEITIEDDLKATLRTQDLN